MGKKGVLLDNGKSAQSSMALYWKKNRQQQNKPKKEYEPTEEQQLDQRAESGFQKWKLHKEKMITKSYNKKQKHAQKDEGAEQQQEEMIVETEKNVGPARIPGFKSKEQLQKKLKMDKAKQVDQSNNILQLPSHMSELSQDDIIRLLRQKKAKKQLEKNKKKQGQNQEDVLLGEDFLSSFKSQAQKKKEEEQLKQKEEQEKLEQQKKKQYQEQHFFKSDLLNELARGNTSALEKKEQIPEAKESVQLCEQPKPEDKKVLKPLFKPRILGKR